MRNYAQNVREQLKVHYFNECNVLPWKLSRVGNVRSRNDK